MQVSLFILRALCAYMREHGGTDEFMAMVGVRPEQLEGSYGLADLDVTVRAARVAYELTRDPALALRLGASLPPQTTVVLGSLFAACPTLRSALAELQRYLPLIMSNASLTLREDERTAYLVFDPQLPKHADLRFTFELTFAWLVCGSYQFIGKHTAPDEIRFPYPVPHHASEYAAVFRCPLVFGAERGEIVFDRVRLDTRQPCSDESLVDVLKVHAESLLRHLPNSPVHIRVRAVLHEDRLARCDGGFALVKEQLGLSARSLARMLAREGHSFSALRDEVRQQQALRLLTETDSPIKAISESLGFSELSPFYRAFKRWTNGMTPLDYRNHQRQFTLGMPPARGRAARPIA